MIVARALQGAFGGVLIPLSFQLIVTELPASRHPLGMALVRRRQQRRAGGRPVLGGWLTDMYSWRWIFYLQIPPALVLLAAIGWAIKPQPCIWTAAQGGLAWHRDDGHRTERAADRAGGGRTQGLVRLEFHHEHVSVAVVGLTIFVVVQLRREEPFINLRLLARYNFGIASLMQFLFGAVVFGVVFLVPNYFAELQGYSARDIGVMMVPYGLVQFVMSFLTPPLMRRTSARTAIIAGFTLVAIGCLMNIHLDVDASANVVVPSLIVRGIGQSLVVVALGVMAVDGIEKSQLGSASGLFSMVRNLGGAIGIAIASQIVVEREKLHAARIGEAITPFNGAFQERMIDMVRVLTQSHLGRADAMAASGLAGTREVALGIVDKVIGREALLMAYSDTFFVAGIAMLGCTLAAFALRSRRKGA